MFVKDGVKKINDTIAQFEKIKISLQEGVQLCDQKNAEDTEVIKSISERVDNRIVVKDRAIKFIDNLDKLLPAK